MILILMVNIGSTRWPPIPSCSVTFGVIVTKQCARLADHRGGPQAAAVATTVAATSTHTVKGNSVLATTQPAAIELWPRIVPNSMAMIAGFRCVDENEQEIPLWCIREQCRPQMLALWNTSRGFAVGRAVRGPS
jgi:hypothetical protein